jgi:hypothetical protein
MLEKLIKKPKKALEDMFPPKDANKHVMDTMKPKKSKEKEVEIEIEKMLSSAKKKKK